MGQAGRPRRVHCKVCNRHKDECGELSARGKCIICGTGASIVQNYEMANHSGEFFNSWRARQILSMGGILPDDLKKYAE